MKVAVINYTGTVGKTTICAHLLAPRMINPEFFAIESINETAEGLGMDVSRMRGDKFRDFLKKLFVADNAIVDIGASNAESFLDGMMRFESSHEDIDYFVVPVTPGTKEQKESIAILNTLAEMNVPPAKIRVLFNRVEVDVEQEFKFLVAYGKENRNFVINLNAAIYENELFDAMSARGISINSLLDDPVDYKALRRDNPDASHEEKLAWGDMHGLKLLAKGVSRNLDTVFAELFN